MILKKKKLLILNFTLVLVVHLKEYMCICMYVYYCRCIRAMVQYRNQRTFFGSRFSPHTLWDPGIELRSSHLHEPLPNEPTYWPHKKDTLTFDTLFGSERSLPLILMIIVCHHFYYFCIRCGPKSKFAGKLFLVCSHCLSTGEQA